MSYCSNCGTSIPAGAKFCPSCGAKISINQAKNYVTEYSQKMYKNAVMSLKNEAKNMAERKVKETIESFMPKAEKITQQTQSVSEVFTPQKSFANEGAVPTEQKGGINIWTWVFVVLNILLVYKGYRLNEVMGLILFSIIIGLIVFLRREKPRPYNWLVKIFITIQVVFLMALLVDRIQFLGTITLLMIGLLAVDFILLFKGNNS